MILNYRLNKHLLARAAAELVWKLQQIDCSINIISDRMLNAKSLVGVLSGNLRYGTEIKVSFDKEEFLNEIKEAFDEVGELI